MKVKVCPSSRRLCVLYTVAGDISFLIVFSLLQIFLLDLDYFDKYNLPRISKNFIFYIGDNKIITKLITNTTLILTFWLSHVILANQKVKEFIGSFSKYLVYERGFYIITADFCVFILLLFWQPITEIKLFSFKDTLLNKLFNLIYSIGILEFTMTMQFIIETDLFGIKRMNRVMNQNEIEFPAEVKISVPLIYRACRHPMQSGFIMLILFSSSNYNLGRVLFATMFLIGINIGVRQEEKYLEKYEEYRQYETEVTNRFIPNIFNLIKKFN